MISNKQFSGLNISLRDIELDDCNENYLSWLNNSQVNQYLETRWQEQTLGLIADFIQSQRESKDSYLMAIIENETQKHIGNIKIGPINKTYGYADISYFIGDTACWGLGYATEAIRLMTHFGFSELGLFRIQAGVYEGNVGSAKALEKLGYHREGCLRKKFLSNGIREDHLLFGILKEEWI